MTLRRTVLDYRTGEPIRCIHGNAEGTGTPTEHPACRVGKGPGAGPFSVLAFPCSRHVTKSRSGRVRSTGGERVCVGGRDPPETLVAGREVD